MKNNFTGNKQRYNWHQTQEIERRNGYGEEKTKVYAV